MMRPPPAWLRPCAPHFAGMLVSYHKIQVLKIDYSVEVLFFVIHAAHCYTRNFLRAKF